MSIGRHCDLRACRAAVSLAVLAMPRALMRYDRADAANTKKRTTSIQTSPGYTWPG